MQDEQALIHAFQTMWGRYDEPVRLIHRSFRVVAANEAYLRVGGKVGVQCNTGDPAMHRGCRAMAALKTGETQKQSTEANGVQWVNYWVPVDGHNDYYIHFTNGMNAYIAKKAAAAAAT